ncbi:MAG: PDR/VanB family oxidoreductase [Pseudomonadota bacterium]
MRSTPHWNEAVISSFCDVTPTVREFCIEPAGGAAAYEPGSHLQVQLLVHGKPVTRSYSLIAEPESGCYRIAVKRLDDGKGGSLAMWKLAVGDRLQVNEPQNFFPLDLNAPAYLLVAGGIGITPLVLMARTLGQRGARARLLFGARSQTELAFLPQLQQSLGGNVGTAVAESGQQIDFAGEIAALPTGAQMYVCGPVPMLDAARQAWASAGRPLADLRYETFGNSGRFAPQAFRVQIPRHQMDIMVPADCSLLDALEQAGLQTISNCKRGECGLCVMEVLSVKGEMDHRDVFLSEHEKKAQQRICICVSRVLGEVVLESAYRPEV